MGRVVLVALSVSVVIELVQVLVVLRLGDVAREADIDDVILNTAGAAVGWLIWRLAGLLARGADPT